VAADRYIQSLIKHDDPIPLGVVEQDVSFGDLVGEFFRKLGHPAQKSFLEDVYVSSNAA